MYDKQLNKDVNKVINEFLECVELWMNGVVFHVTVDFWFVFLFWFWCCGFLGSCPQVVRKLSAMGLLPSLRVMVLRVFSRS